MARKIKINYNKLAKELGGISYHFFTDWVIELLPIELMKKTVDYYNLPTKNFEYMQYVGLISKLISELVHPIFGELIIMNNLIVKENRWDEKSSEQLISDYKSSDLLFSLGNRKPRSEMMIVYYYSKGLLKKDELLKTLEYYEIKNQEIVKNLEDKPDLFVYYKELRESLSKENLLKFDTYINITSNPTISEIEEKAIKKIENKFRCEFSDNKFNGINKELIYFMNSNLLEIEKLNLELMTTNALMFSNLKLIQQKSDNFDKKILLLNQIKDDNRKLKLRNKELKQENHELRVSFSKDGERDLELENTKLKRENYLLNLELEKLRNQIAILEEEEAIKETIQEEIEIDQLIETKIDIPEMSSICVLGGKWNSLRQGQVEEYFWNYNSDIEFFEAEKSLRYQERIKNKDIVIFDTSYNSHSLYYKFKDFIDLKISHSNLLSIKEKFEQN